MASQFVFNIAWSCGSSSCSKYCCFLCVCACAAKGMQLPRHVSEGDLEAAPSHHDDHETSENKAGLL